MGLMMHAAIRSSGLIAAILCNTMCVYIEQEDELLSGTSWFSDEVPLGPLGVSAMTLEFFEDGEVEIILDLDSQIYTSREEVPETIKGHYDQDGNTVVFSGVKMTLNGVNVTFIEAHLNAANTLFLLWRIEDILYPFTTALQPATTS